MMTVQQEEKNAGRTTDYITRKGQLLIKIHNLGIKKKSINLLQTAAKCVCMAKVSGSLTILCNVENEVPVFTSADSITEV